MKRKFSKLDYTAELAYDYAKGIVYSDNETPWVHFEGLPEDELKEIVEGLASDFINFAYDLTMRKARG
jgi:hypothetical protein